MTTLNNFKNFALTSTQTNNIIGGQSWKQLKGELSAYKGDALTGIAAEPSYAFNINTGTMDESGFVTVTLEFESGNGTTLNVDKDCLSSYISRINRFFA